MLITKNNFWISLLGAVWLYFSSYIQWWFSSVNMPEMLAASFLAFIALVYILF
jgi:hypothetical protein